MYDLTYLDKSLKDMTANGTITESEAEQLYETMYDEQVNDLILDIYESFANNTISEDEANAFLKIVTEAVKGDKLSKNEKNKIDDELDNLPDKERKAVEDSIKKASKESNNKKAANKAETLNKIDKALKIKKEENK